MMQFHRRKANQNKREDLQDDRQSTHERTLRGGRLCRDFLFSLGMSHLRFTLFFTRPACRRGRSALVLVMPARPHNAISGILAGGDPGFRHCDFFALAPIGPSGDVFCVSSCCFQRMACSVLGTQVALSHHFSLRRVMMPPFHCFCFLVVGFLFCCLFSVCG